MSDNGDGGLLGGTFRELAQRLSALLDVDPSEAVRQVRRLDSTSSDGLGTAALRAAILVDGGSESQQRDAIEEGLGLFRKLHDANSTPDIAYNLANAVVSLIGGPPHNSDWLDYQERTHSQRAEARNLYWRVGQDISAERVLRTQAWTNLANLFTSSYRLGEAHDARLGALAIDPSNGVAAGSAARDLLWLFDQGGCSDLTRVEALMLAKIARQHRDRIQAYAGTQAAKQLAALADQLGDPPLRSSHTDPFVRWVESERLTLAPVVELVEPALGKLDWLMLPGIMEREPGATPGVPPVFAMFNQLKADFILARDLAWRATDDQGWPTTGRFADTLDYATYGPKDSAIVLAHRTALDLLDKVAVTANHYFQIGLPPNKVHFGKIWRHPPAKSAGLGSLVPPVEKAIRNGAPALYGLVELAHDYESVGGILRLQKDLRNAGTHRFVVLHDLGPLEEIRFSPEIEHHDQQRFTEEVLSALRVARSALQMLALAIRQHEQRQVDTANGFVPALLVPDHDWVRGREGDTQ